MWGDIQDIFLFGCPKTIDITGFFKKFCIATRTRGIKKNTYSVSNVLADIIVPQEYGMYTWEKMLIGRNIVKNLLIKIDVVRERKELHYA